MRVRSFVMCEQEVDSPEQHEKSNNWKPIHAERHLQHYTHRFIIAPEKNCGNANWSFPSVRVNLAHKFRNRGKNRGSSCLGRRGKLGTLSLGRSCPATYELPLPINSLETEEFVLQSVVEDRQAQSIDCQERNSYLNG